MPSKNHTAKKNNKNRGVRQHDLMMQSEEYGQLFRKKHQGEDVIKDKIQDKDKKSEKTKSSH